MIELIWFSFMAWQSTSTSTRTHILNRCTVFSKTVNVSVNEECPVRKTIFIGKLFGLLSFFPSFCIGKSVGKNTSSIWPRIKANSVSDCVPLIRHTNSASPRQPSKNKSSSNYRSSSGTENLHLQ